MWLRNRWVGRASSASPLNSSMSSILAHGTSPNSFGCNAGSVPFRFHDGRENGLTCAKNSPASIPYNDAVRPVTNHDCSAFRPFSLSLSHHSGITKMLQSLGLSFDGRHHSGLDDSINIARIALELIKVRHSSG